MKSNDLQVIKEGKTGHGILIENDGFVKLNQKQLKENIDDNEWHVPYPFIVDAVFQKFGIKNANGRIYPEDVLKREVEKYQQKIDERNAYGECYKPNAKILTETGWKTLEEVKEGENILTLNPITLETEYKPIIRKIEKEFDGDLITLATQKNYFADGIGIDDSVTPNHKFPIFEKDENDSTFKYVDNFEAYKLKNINGYIPLTTKPCFHLFKREGNDDTEFANLKDIIFNTEPYKGKVMCVEVENHIWYVMCNGKTHWTCNCNHPSDSTINLSRVSHNIVELHWENATLVGKLEINTSEGFRRNGIVTTCGDEIANLLMNGYKIGVSSRGVGSVEQKLGQYIVGDDFELICWDIVSDPSTPGAYIGHQESLQQYIESEQKNKSAITEKISKIKNILNS